MTPEHLAARRDAWSVPATPCSPRRSPDGSSSGSPGRTARPSRCSGDLATLTPRELEVLRHVARGLSNAEVADRLTLSEATVKTHVARIFAKLELRDRAQAVVVAYESGLIRPGD